MIKIWKISVQRLHLVTGMTFCTIWKTNLTKDHDVTKQKKSENNHKTFTKFQRREFEPDNIQRYHSLAETNRRSTITYCHHHGHRR